MSRFLGFAFKGPLLVVLYLIVFSGLMAGCAESATAEPAPLNQWYAILIGGKTIEIQIAHKDIEMAKGLMYRKSLGENRGMLFFYDPPKQMSFWMRNTKIPLDIGYFTSDGVLREIYPMHPMDEQGVKSRRDDLLMALEMNQGWYAKNGIKVGDTFDLNRLKKALLSRGVNEIKIPF
ncbi:MAG: DUF192 domain-containing protein [Verrucomicrobia bacterium]|nr:DUF192 domain-containing protein [Verrucomicrobiota bacterium]